MCSGVQQRHQLSPRASGGAALSRVWKGEEVFDGRRAGPQGMPSRVNRQQWSRGLTSAVYAEVLPSPVFLK